MYIQTLISENIKLSLGFILHLFLAKNINLFRKYFADKDMAFVGHLGVELDLGTSKGRHIPWSRYDSSACCSSTSC